MKIKINGKDISNYFSPKDVINSKNISGGNIQNSISPAIYVKIQFSSNISIKDFCKIGDNILILGENYNIFEIEQISNIIYCKRKLEVDAENQ